MKAAVFFLLMAINACFVLAQEDEPDPYALSGNKKATLYIKVTDSLENGMTYLDFWITETETNFRIDGFTDRTGKAAFSVMRGKKYMISFPGFENLKEIEIPATGYSSIVRTVKIPRSDYLTQRMDPDTVVQNINQNKRPDQGKIYVKIILVNPENRPVIKEAVRLFDAHARKVYTTFTDQKGNAVFMVDPMHRYVFGIDVFDNYTTIETKDYSTGMVIEYSPTKIKETTRNDTVFQQIPSFTKPTTLRVLLRLYLTDHDKKFLVGEPVYLDQTGTSKVFKAVTDSKGVATFLLPKGNSYILNFTYERGMKLLQYPLDISLFTTNIRTNYIGSKKVEDFYRQTARNNKFRIEFMSPKVEPAHFDYSVVEKLPNGFKLNFEGSHPACPPSIVDDRLFVSPGFYSSEIFCLDRMKATEKWSIKLAEGGPSSVVYSDGMIFINTQSCTLYSIDAETGVLAWSKWLGPNIYTTPTVHEKVVYTVYPNDLNTTGRDSNFVMVAFELKTGNILWQNWMDAEALGSPVVYNSVIYTTDLRGKVYSFDAIGGKLLASAPVYAVTPPVVLNQDVWVNVRSQQAGKIEPALLDAKTLIPRKTLPQFAMNQFFEWPMSLSADQLMCLNAGRPLIYKNHNFQQTGTDLVCYSTTNGELKWKTSPGQPAVSAMPLEAGGKIVVPLAGGKLLLVQPEDGKIINTIQLGEEMVGGPIFHQGWVYSSTTDGKSIAIDTKNKELTGWPAWGRTSNHNCVVE